MASSLTIATGPLSSTINFLDDDKVQATLLRYYEILGLGPPDATNAEKLDEVNRSFVQHVMRTVKRYEFDVRLSTLEPAIDADYGLDEDTA